MAVDNQSVVGRDFGISLPCDGVSVGRYVLPSENINHTGNLFCNGGVDFADDCIGMGAAQQLDYQRIIGDNVLGVNRLACQQLHRVLLGDRTIDRLIVLMLHTVPPYALRLSR